MVIISIKFLNKCIFENGCNVKIHIFYRHYNVHGNDKKNRPDWFDFENCFLNLTKTIENKNVNLHLVMDGELETNFISKYKNSYQAHIINAGSDMKSFWNTFEIIKRTEIEDGDLIYLLENDYLHTPNWVDKILELFETYIGLDYVSLYDHNDKYNHDSYKNLTSKLFVTNTHHWRTTPSTCGSFIFKKNVFVEDYDEHLNFTTDHEKFLYLAKIKKRTVITPIPGLSTHCMSGLLSPTINWQNVSMGLL